METRLEESIDSASQMKKATTTENSCRHHWLLGQPADGKVSAKCCECGLTRDFPASLEDYDRGLESERRFYSSVATAAGGARPSSTALLPDYES